MKNVKINCDASELQDAEKKVKHLVELIKEANALVDELASKKIDLEISI